MGLSHLMRCTKHMQYARNGRLMDLHFDYQASFDPWTSTAKSNHSVAVYISHLPPAALAWSEECQGSSTKEIAR